MAENSDKNLIQRLITEQELSGLLNVALIRLKKLHKEEGFEDTGIEEIRKQYELGASKIQNFVKEHCILEPENTSLVTTTLDLQNGVRQYCKSKGSDYVDIKSIGETLKALGVMHERKRRKVKLEYFYVGIGLRCSNVLYNSPTSLPAVATNKSSVDKEGDPLPGTLEQLTKLPVTGLKESVVATATTKTPIETSSTASDQEEIEIHFCEKGCNQAYATREQPDYHNKDRHSPASMGAEV